jgi:hypothetical protein
MNDFREVKIMRSLSRKIKYFLVVGVLIISILACSSSDSETSSEVDLAATQQSMEATQRAMETALAKVPEESPTQPQEEPSPTEAPPTQSAPTEAPQEQPTQETTGGGVDVSNLQSGDIIYRTDFEDSEDWTTYSTHVNSPDNYEAYTENGFLYLQANSRHMTVYAIYENLYLGRGDHDVRLEVSVETVAGPNTNNISLVCRYTDEGWYEFSMGSNGLWQIWKYTESDGYNRLANGGSNEIKMKLYKTNVIAATCIGDKFTLYINGVETHTITDLQFRQGQVGVSISTFDIEGAGVEFDYFSVSKP